jgi:hypothetical protein
LHRRFPLVAAGHVRLQPPFPGGLECHESLHPALPGRVIRHVSL